MQTPRRGVLASKAATVSAMLHERPAIVDLTGGRAPVGLSRLTSLGGPAIVVVEDYLDPAIAAINVDFRILEAPWVLFRPGDPFVVLGPLFRPRTSPCWSCLADALRFNEALLAHRAEGAALKCPLGRSDLPQEVTRALQDCLRNPGVSAVAGELQIFSREGVHIASHRVRRRPQCPVCGDPSLARRPAAGPSVARCALALEGLDDPVTGMMAPPERLIVPNAPPTFVFSAAMGSPSALARRHSARTGFFPRSFGKGLDRAEAHRSCILEAVERSSLAYRDGDATRNESAARLSGEDYLHPETLSFYSFAQQLTSGAAEAAQIGDAWTLDPFDPTRPIDWVEVWSLRDGRPKLAPAAFCYLDYHLPEGHRFCRSDSTGCAAGVSDADALVRGFCELVERDAAAIWWYNRLRCSGLDPASLRESRLQRLVECLSSADRQLRILNLTLDFPPPVFAAVSARSDGSDVLVGLGCDLHPEKAAEKALLEIALALASRSSGSPASRLHIGEHDYLEPAGPASDIAQFADLRTGDRSADLAHCADWTHERGLDLLYLDALRPELGVPVVRTIAPGMRTLRPQFAPGRLYDVPFQIGRLSTRRREVELNPLAFPL